MNIVDRHLCWNTFKEDSLENAFYCTRDFAFLAIEIIYIWKSELFLIFDQLFCEASISIFMQSICDIIQLFPWQKEHFFFQERHNIKCNFLEKGLFKSFVII